MNVIVEIDHTICKEEIISWIEEVLMPNNPCVWGYSFEEHHCGSCHNSQLEKELAEGKPKWHDLRENPNDLPTKNDEYYCYVYEQGYEIHRFNIFQNCFLGVFSRVIAWCELPEFEE